MKHEGPKSGQTRGARPAAGQRGAVGPASRDAALVGRRYETAAALRASDHSGGAEATAAGLGSVESRASDLHARHGATLREGGARSGVPESAIAAVVLAESGLLGDLDAARAPLRFEPYAFYERTGRWLVATHKDQEAEYAAFEQARQVDDAAAHASVRVGVGQVSGAEAEAAGFADPAAMIAEMHGNEAAQLDGLVALIQQDEPLCAALGAEDWAQVAELRAGPGYGAIAYDEALASYAEAYARAASGADHHADYGGDDDGEDDKKKRGKSSGKGSPSQG